jgi:PAS domain S-box-containing protein
MRVTQVNPAVHKLLGVSDRDFLGTSIQSWVTEEDRQSTFAQLESCKSAADGAIFEARMRHSDGTTVYTSWNARWSGERNSFFCVMHDITERKEVEQLKQQVLAMVSHDLRSPLASIGITMELLKEGVFGTLNEKGTSVLDKAQGSITSLVTMVNELLEIERFEYGGGALNMVRAPILQSALNAIDLVGAQADKKGIEIETKCGKIESTFDPERITRVFANLLGNAIKFAPEHSEIMITATAIEDGTPAKNRWIEVRVSDQGSGIPPEKQSVIFEKFKQSGRNDAGEKAGTGLGLAICKAIVEAHGGTIGVESTIGEGSTFWFRLKQD